MKLLEIAEYNPKHEPLRRADGSTVDAIWKMYLTKQDTVDYWIHTVYDTETGEILHLADGKSDTPKDEELKLEVLNNLRSIPAQAHFSNLNIEYSDFINKAGISDVWIKAIVNNKTGEILHHEELKGVTDESLKHKARSFLQLRDQDDYTPSRIK